MLPDQLFDTEVLALRILFNADLSWVGITKRQCRALNILLSQGLCDKSNRIGVVKLLTGLPYLSSTKQLTLHTASVLISFLMEAHDGSLSEQGRWLISTAEKRVEEQLAGQQKGIDTLWNAPDMSSM